MSNIRAPSKSRRQAQPTGRNAFRQWTIPVLIVVLTVIAFYPALQNGFVNWDDDKNIVENPFYRGLHWTNIRWMFTTFHMGHYQPLTWVTLGIDYLFWGLNPFGYHLTNLVLHAATAVLFFPLRESLAEAHAGLARALSAQGNKDEAVQHYQEAVRLLKSQSQSPNEAFNQ